MSEWINYETGELGKVEIAPEVIQTISGLAAIQVEEVYGLAGGVVGDFNQWMGRKNLRKGTRVHVGDQTVIELSIVVYHNCHIPEVGRKIQENVKTTIESMTGLIVDQVIVRVEGIKFPQSEKAAEIEVSRLR